MAVFVEEREGQHQEQEQNKQLHVRGHGGNASWNMCITVYR